MLHHPASPAPNVAGPTCVLHASMPNYLQIAVTPYTTSTNDIGLTPTARSTEWVSRAGGRSWNRWSQLTTSSAELGVVVVREPVNDAAQRFIVCWLPAQFTDQPDDHNNGTWLSFMARRGCRDRPRGSPKLRCDFLGMEPPAQLQGRPATVLWPTTCLLRMVAAMQQTLVWDDPPGGPDQDGWLQHNLINLGQWIQVV